jgi:hypothetical protein
MCFQNYGALYFFGSLRISSHKGKSTYSCLISLGTAVFGFSNLQQSQNPFARLSLMGKAKARYHDPSIKQSKKKQRLPDEFINIYMGIPTSIHNSTCNTNKVNHQIQLELRRLRQKLIQAGNDNDKMNTLVWAEMQTQTIVGCQFRQLAGEEHDPARYPLQQVA